MRATTQLVLVLMGGGALTAGTAASMEAGRACRDARARADPQAETICRGSGGFHGFHVGPGGWFGVNRWSTGMPATGVGAVSRGGFGLFGLHFGGFHG
jgi:hypothetical protein